MSTSSEIHQQTPSSDDHTITIKTTYEYAETDDRIGEAAILNKWDDVCELFEGRPELMTKPVNERLETPLMIAVRWNCHEFVKQLLNNVETHDRDKWCGVNFIGDNALHYAVRAGNIEDAKLMLQCLPETMTTIKNIHGDTPGTLAAKLGRKDMIDEVFNEYADAIKMAYEYEENDVKIYKAALRNKWDDVRKLFEERPQLKTKPVNERLETPLMIAVGTNRSHEFVKQLLNNVDHGGSLYDDEWCGMNIHGNNALHYAAKVGNIIDAKLMMQCLPQRMTWNENIDGDTPLLLATKLGRKDMNDQVFSQYDRRYLQLSGDIIVSAIQAGFLDLASDRLKCTLPEETAYANGLEALATKPESFRSGNGFGFWCGLICPWMRTVKSKIPTSLRRICRLTTIISVVLLPFVYVKTWLQQIQEYIRKKTLISYDLLIRLCNEIEINPKNAKKFFEPAITKAVKYGTVELIEECILAYPGLIWYEFDGYNLFHLAIKERQVQVYNLVYQMSEDLTVPVTVPLDESFRGHAVDLTEDDPRVKRSVKGFEPEQIMVSLSSGYESVWVSWVTGKFQIGDNIKPLDPKSVASVVEYSKVKSLKTQTQQAEGYSLIYSQLYPYKGLQNYTSGIIHHVQLKGLSPDTIYYYRCGDPSIKAMSDVFTFKTMPISGPKSYPKIGLVGDLGLTHNTTSTVSHLIKNQPDLVLLIGDATYANLYLTNGTGSDCYSCSFDNTPIHETYQPRWDYWGRYMQRLTSKIPIMAIEGNHEIEEQVESTTFAAYSARFAFPSEESGSKSTMYYSFNAGGIHFLMLGGYTAYDKSSDQYKWLQRDLEKVDREVTPWLVGVWHPPWYNTYVSHYKEVECMRVAMEELLYNAGVDIIFNGHVHAYERSNRVYNYTLDPCGPVHITIGDGGNREKMAVEHADEPGNCQEPSTTPDSFMGGFCAYNFTSGPAKGNFCWDRQPEYSAYRESSFGHGIFEVKNETHALWTWHRNQDMYNEVGDQIFIVREPERCPVNLCRSLK